MTGFVPPSQDEILAVGRLKEKLFHEHPDARSTFTDTAVLRFLRGRKDDEEKGYRALIKHLEWRKEHNVDTIAQDISKFEHELKSGKMVVEGYDLHGRPTIFVSAHKHNKYHRNLEELQMLIIYTMEEILKKARPEEERIMICFDLSGFSLSCMDYDAVKLLVNILQFNYPDTLHLALVINSPWMFSACWAIIRPWLDPITAAKALFVNKNQLTEYFPADKIPKMD
jgi:hypothetical protein